MHLNSACQIGAKKKGGPAPALAHGRSDFSETVVHLELYRMRRHAKQRDFLRAGGVFTDDLIETWVAYKREYEIDPVRLRPHPWEFMLYYDI